MGNVCGGTKALNDHPTHHRLGSVSDTPHPPIAGNNAAPTQAPKPKPKVGKSPAVDASGADERARRAQAAEERAKAAASRGTVASNPKQGQLAAKLNQPIDRTNNNNGREEEPLRWD
ncbi:unnamed protein product [Rhizoctonia solani]|uniref:Uncharacterized protein n=1 Tax=Rhizoctonia solani TaxID=456999 RepID=A0A8H3DPG8_9AGAM|nr:unnamed protein product [Rhizoctonia solani]